MFCAVEDSDVASCPYWADCCRVGFVPVAPIRMPLGHVLAGKLAHPRPGKCWMAEQAAGEGYATPKPPCVTPFGIAGEREFDEGDMVWIIYPRIAVRCKVTRVDRSYREQHPDGTLFYDVDEPIGHSKMCIRHESARVAGVYKGD